MATTQQWLIGIAAVGSALAAGAGIGLLIMNAQQQVAAAAPRPPESYGTP